MEEYFYPSSLEEAISLLEADKDIRPIAGGTEINLKHKDVDCLVDLGNLGLNYIKSCEGGVIIGATTTIADIEESPIIGQFKALHDAASCFTGSVKHLATIGGNIAESVASSDMAPPLIALGAKAVLVSSKGERVLPVYKIFRGLRKTSIKKGEILKEFFLPEESKDSKNTASSFQRLGRTEEDLSITSVAVRLTMERERIKDAGIGVGLAAPIPLKAVETEKFLRENGLLVERASEVLIKETNPRSSIRASREYRLMLEKSLFKRALLECGERLR